MHKFRTYGLIGLAAVVAVSSALAQDTFSLRRKPKVGDTAQFKLSGSMEIMGTQAEFTFKVAEKVVKVEADGKFAVESSQMEGKIKFGDQEMDAPSSGSETTVYEASGEVVSISGADVTDANYRVSALQGMIVDGGSYKVGDEIKWTVKPNAKNGNTKGEGKAKITKAEKWNSYDAVVIEYSYKEATGSEPAESAGTVWLNKADGSLLMYEGTYKNAPFPGAPMPITAKIKMERI